MVPAGAELVRAVVFLLRIRQMRYFCHVPHFSVCFSQSHDQVLTPPVLSELSSISIIE